MISRMCAAMVVLGAWPLFVVADASARSNSGSHSGVHVPAPVTGATRHHHFPNRVVYPYRRAIILGAPYYQYGNAPVEQVGPPVSEQTVVERRRECEPKSYTVPNVSGGESQVTIIRC